MRVLLVQPPFYRMIGGRNNWVNLGLGYLAAMLDKHGFEVKVYNADHVDDARDLNLREVFEGKSIYDGIMGDVNHPLWNEIISEIKDYNPDLVGFTINFTLTAKIVERLADLLKEWKPDLKIVVGGPTVTLLPEIMLRHESYDFAIRGEGEYTLLELVRRADISTIAGLSYKKDNIMVYHNPDRELIKDLDRLPFPDIKLQLKHIQNPEDNYGVIACTRGCCFHCTFCSSPTLWRKKVRYRSVNNVIEEIKLRYYNYGVKKYYFSDDNFNLNKKYTVNLCKKIIEDNLDIEWICEAQLKTFDREVLDAMKTAGCKRVKLGIESGNDRILNMMQKGVTKERIRNVVRLIKEVGIDITAYFLIGMPTETREEMLETYRFAEEINPEYVSLSVASPQYGTPLFDMMQDMGIQFSVEDWLEHFHQSYKTVLNDNVSEDIIEKFLSFNEKKGFARKI